MLVHATPSVLRYRMLSWNTWVEDVYGCCVCVHTYVIRTCIHPYIHTFLRRFVKVSHAHKLTCTLAYRQTDRQTDRHACIRHVCIHEYMHTCISSMYAYIYIYAYTQSSIHAHMGKRARIHIHIHTCVHAYIPTYIHAYVHKCLHTYIRSLVPAFVHACVHGVRTHTCIRRCLRGCVHTCTYIPIGSCI